MKKCEFFRMVMGDNKKPSPKITEGFCDTFTDKNGNEMVFCFHGNECAKK